MQPDALTASAAAGENAPIIEGAEPAIVGQLLAEAMCDARWSQCSVTLISGGKSNLTYRVRSDAGEVILRRPPLGHVLPTAHDTGREYRVVTALRDTPVPVPRTFYVSPAASALGAPFYVMERVVGHVCRDALPYATTVQEREAIGAGLVDVLTALHTVDLGRSGWGTSAARRASWSGSCAAGPSSGCAPRPPTCRPSTRCATVSPPPCPHSRRPPIVHGDYRLDNALLHPDRRADVAVLDWEMSTLGDPLADLGALLAYWSESDDDDVLVRARMFAPVTAAPGFPSRAEVVDRYGAATGLDVSAISWYQAFAFFKLAVICRGLRCAPPAGRCSAPASTTPKALSNRSSRRAVTTSTVAGCSAAGPRVAPRNRVAEHAAGTPGALAEHELLDLARARLRQLVDDLDRLGNLEAGRPIV